MTKIEFYLSKGMDKEEAELALSKRQTTFSLDICIEKHGEEQGTIIWKERQDKWQQTLKSKSIEEIKEINKKKVSKGYTISKYEKQIINHLTKNNLNIESQYVIITPDKSYIFDIANMNNKRIIEFNGDYWHTNPKLYNENYWNDRVKKTAKEIWIRDEKKLQIANDNGFEVLVIWESDFKINEESTLDKCLAFLSFIDE